MKRRRAAKSSSSQRTCAEGKKHKPAKSSASRVRRGISRSRQEKHRKGKMGGAPTVSHAATSARQKSILKLNAFRKGPGSAKRNQRVDIHPLDRAISALRNELARSPDDATLHGRLGALHYRRGDLSEAERYYRRAVSLQPGRPAFHNNLGNVLCDLSRMKEGIACYEAAMALEKSAAPAQGPSAEAEANLELARLEYRLIHERIEYLERAVQLEVGTTEALNALGGGYLLRRQREKALAAFRKAAESDPRNPHAALNIAFVHSLNLEGAADWKAVLAELAECAVRFPHEARFFMHQGELFETAGLLEEAQEQYRRALKTDPRALEPYDLLGRLREALGLNGVRDETARESEAALEGLERAACARRSREGEAAGAGPVLDLALVQLARARLARRPVGDAALVDGLLSEALRLAERGGTTSQVTAIRAVVLRAQLLEGEGRREEAVEALESACEKFPKAGRLWFERGGLALRLGETALAVEGFERATLAEPQEAYAYHSLRFAFEGYRRYRSERVRFESAVHTNPQDALAHHHLALAALSVLKDEEAHFHFTRALELDPRLADAACGRARALQRQGHKAQAHAAYERALEIDPQSAEAQRALQLFALQGNDSPLFPGTRQ